MRLGSLAPGTRLSAWVQSSSSNCLITALSTPDRSAPCCASGGSVGCAVGSGEAGAEGGADDPDVGVGAVSAWESARPRGDAVGVPGTADDDGLAEGEVLGSGLFLPLPLPVGLAEGEAVGAVVGLPSATAKT